MQKLQKLQYSISFNTKVNGKPVKKYFAKFSSNPRQYNTLSENNIIIYQPPSNLI